jgi:O-antigen ligase/Flp pilus assembly protein TadD
VAVDPWGWAPYGPLRWALVSTVCLGIAALTLRLESIDVHKASAFGWLAFLLWGVFAGFGAVDPLYTWIGTPDRHLGLITIVFFAVTFLAGQQLTAPAAVTVLLKTSIIALAAIGAYTVLEVLDFAPVDLVTASDRPGGPYGTAAYLGAACALLIPITIGAAADRLNSARWRYPGYVAAGLGVFAALASQTRAGWVGLIGAAVAALATQRQWLRRNWPALAAATAALVIIAVISPVGSRVTSAFDFREGTARGRLDEWQIGAAVAVNNPVAGVGLEGYRIAFSEGVDADYERRYTRRTMPDRVHNGPLDVAVTTGLPGMALYLTAVTLLVRRAFGGLRAGQPWLRGVAAGVIAYVAQQWFLFPLAEVDPVFWLFAGLLIAVVPAGSYAHITLPRWLWGIPAILAALAFVAGTLDVAADHHVADSLEALAKGDSADALAAANLAAEIRPDSIRYHFIAAAVVAERVTPLAYQAAVDRLDTALDLSPDDPILLADHASFNLRLAQVSRDVALLQEAISEWEALVATDPVHARYRLELGNAYAIAGNDVDAEEQWLVAADLAPRSTTPLTNLARLYVDGDRLLEAIEMLNMARAIDPTAAAIDRLSELITP